MNTDLLEDRDVGMRKLIHLENFIDCELRSMDISPDTENTADKNSNVFVIVAILLERNLQSVANYLILSLAVADLLVACLVMPLAAVYDVSQEWMLGPELCDMWTSSDVLCCTASILHLVAIALDRSAEFVPHQQEPESVSRSDESPDQRRRSLSEMPLNLGSKEFGSPVFDYRRDQLYFTVRRGPTRRARK
ncbi:hypothetical protein WA026_023077 [Henosepilachna vigintioctopunctata]|uniref:G-protein coupled receptors family 1 profile domain-containing protein n=1 Tax=Henosepilachna vigintioctopunctata TaxID=420089 RepID=A0AAW1UDD3_9CUCU